MDDVRIGRSLRELRRRRGLTQARLAEVVGISQQAVSLIERGHLDTLSIRIVRRAFAAVEARFEAAVSWRAGALDRLMDERHAALVEELVRYLQSAGWDVAVEVSFNHYGDRGSIDILALDRISGTALVIEVKTELTAMEETIRRLDVKVRLAPALVEERFGRRPVLVGRLLVLPRSSTSWRRVRSLAATLDVAFPDRGGIPAEDGYGRRPDGSPGSFSFHLPMGVVGGARPEVPAGGLVRGTVGLPFHAPTRVVCGTNAAPATTGVGI